MEKLTLHHELAREAWYSDDNELMEEATYLREEVEAVIGEIIVGIQEVTDELPLPELEITCRIPFKTSYE